METEGRLSTAKGVLSLETEAADRSGSVDTKLLDIIRVIEAYPDAVSYKVDCAKSHEMDPTLAETDSLPSKTKLYNRTVTYTVIGVTCLSVGVIIATAIYATQPIRVANLAILIAFIGLVLFINFSGIAFLTIARIDQANAKEILASTSVDTQQTI